MNNTYLRSFNVDLISSQATTSYSDTHKSFDLKNSIVVPENMHMIIGLTQFNMPYSYYDIRETNASFDVIVDVSGVPVSQNITVPYGNYKSASAFATALNVLFATYASYLGVFITCIADQTKSKFLFTTNITCNSITFQNILPYRQMGFDSEEVFLVESLSTFYATNQYDFSGSPCLYIRLVHKGLHNLNSANNYNGILTCVQMPVYPNEIIFYQNSQPQFFRTDMNNLHNLEVQILDENFESIPELNGAVWRMTLTFDYHYNHEVILSNNNTNKNEENKNEN
jgi:hypothetical protein